MLILLCLGSVSLSSLADGIIPISDKDQTGQNSDFAQTMITIFQSDIVPLIMIVAAVWVIWTGVSTMAGGIKEAQERQKFDPMKNAIIKTVIVVVVGGALLYLLNLVRVFKFS
jgi:hypothetical protein